MLTQETKDAVCDLIDGMEYVTPLDAPVSVELNSTASRPGLFLVRSSEPKSNAPVRNDDADALAKIIDFSRRLNW